MCNFIRNIIYNSIETNIARSFLLLQPSVKQYMPEETHFSGVWERKLEYEIKRTT